MTASVTTQARFDIIACMKINVPALVSAAAAFAALSVRAADIDFQKLIDEAAAKGGGRVVVPAGVHETKSLRLRSGVELHLEKGAVLRGSARREDYFEFPPEICAVRPESSGLALICAWDETDIAITGEGTVEGRSAAFFPRSSRRYAGFWPKPALPRPREVQFVRCRGVRISGVTFRDSPGWTMLIRLCEDVRVDGIAIESNPHVINSDGIDFDACRRVRVSDSRFKTGDDCLILRAMRERPGDSAVCEDVVVSNCVLDSRCQTIRIGSSSDDIVRNAVFKDIRASGVNGIFFDYPVRYVRSYDEGRMCVSNIVFDGYSGVHSGSAVQIVVEDAVKIRGVRDVTFRNFDVKTAQPLRFVGNEASPLENLRFENVTVNGKRLPDGPVEPTVRPSRPLVRTAGWSWEAMGETGFPARDPFVVADGGHYYLYASAAKPGAGGAAELRRGADLVMWTAPEPAVRFPSGAGGRTVSGPSVHRFGGKWWMFAAVSGGAGGPDGACSVCVFVSQRPEGPFKPATAGPVAAAACGGTLHVEDGKPHLVYSVSRDGRCAIEYAPLARGFASLAGRPSKLVDPPDGFAADGPSLHRSAKSGRLYLLWTRTGPGGERCIMARSSPSGKIAGPWTGDELLVAGACGRGMAFRGLDGRLRIVFERPGAEGNPMDIRYLDDDGARLSVEGR